MARKKELMKSFCASEQLVWCTSNRILSQSIDGFVLRETACASGTWQKTQQYKHLQKGRYRSAKQLIRYRGTALEQKFISEQFSHFFIIREGGLHVVVIIPLLTTRRKRKYSSKHIQYFIFLSGAKAPIYFALVP